MLRVSAHRGPRQPARQCFAADRPWAGQHADAARPLVDRAPVISNQAREASSRGARQGHSQRNVRAAAVDGPRWAIDPQLNISKNPRLSPANVFAGQRTPARRGGGACFVRLRRRPQAGGHEQNTLPRLAVPDSEALSQKQKGPQRSGPSMTNEAEKTTARRRQSQQDATARRAPT